MNINLPKKIEELKTLHKQMGLLDHHPMGMMIQVLELMLLEIQNLEKKQYRGQKGKD